MRFRIEFQPIFSFGLAVVFHNIRRYVIILPFCAIQLSFTEIYE